MANAHGEAAATLEPLGRVVSSWSGADLRVADGVVVGDARLD